MPRRSCNRTDIKVEGVLDEVAARGAEGEVGRCTRIRECHVLLFGAQETAALYR